MNNENLIVLIAPNVAPHMGGEAIKASQTFAHYKSYHKNTLLITHARNLDAMRANGDVENVLFIKDGLLTITLWKSVVFRSLINVLFSKQAVNLAEEVACKRGLSHNQVIIHQIGPNSPVLPRAISSKYKNTFGPINGNIYYPKQFQYFETLADKLRRILHKPLQILNGSIFGGIKKADMIFMAGGARTYESLVFAGCHPNVFVPTLDCGVDDVLLERPRITHDAVNYRFIHFGRLVKFKCTQLIIKSLVKTNAPVLLDIVGYGPELEVCKALVNSLGLNERVRFLPWKEHDSLINSLHQYRGVVLPSIAESNGIAIQESMALGLPPICMDWGGPQLLIDHNQSGYLIPPNGSESVILTLANCLDTLSEDHMIAEKISIAARKKAQSWGWQHISKQWISHYDGLVSAHQRDGGLGVKCESIL